MDGYSPLLTVDSRLDRFYSHADGLHKSPSATSITPLKRESRPSEPDPFAFSDRPFRAQQDLNDNPGGIHGHVRHRHQGRDDL